MYILPAIDLRGGRVVRLLRGDYDKMTVFGDAPAETARGFAEKGAKWLHLVDLDGAKDGEPVNFAVIAETIAAGGLKTEVGGGIRDAERIAKYLAAGAERVILGTAAVRDFGFTAEMAREYGGRVAVGVDARDGRVAVNGWLETSGEDSFDFCERLAAAGVKTVVYTDIACDGAESGTNLAAYERLSALPLDVVASGGISSVSELDALAALGAAGAIIGKALYTGALELGALIERYED